MAPAGGRRTLGPLQGPTPAILSRGASWRRLATGQRVGLPEPRQLSWQREGRSRARLALSLVVPRSARTRRAAACQPARLLTARRRRRQSVATRRHLARPRGGAGARAPAASLPACNRAPYRRLGHRWPPPSQPPCQPPGNQQPTRRPSRSPMWRNPRGGGVCGMVAGALTPQVGGLHPSALPELGPPVQSLAALAGALHTRAGSPVLPAAPCHSRLSPRATWRRQPPLPCGCGSSHLPGWC